MVHSFLLFGFTLVSGFIGTSIADGYWIFLLRIIWDLLYNDKYPIEKVQNLWFFISNAISTASTNVRTLFIIFFRVNSTYWCRDSGRQLFCVFGLLFICLTASRSYISWMLCWWIKIFISYSCWNISELPTSPHHLKLLGWTGRCMQLNMVSKLEVSSLNPG